MKALMLFLFRLSLFRFCPLVMGKVLTANCQPIVFWAKVETRERVWSCIYCRIDCTGEEATLFGARFLESWTHLFTHLPVPIRQYSVRARGQALESDKVWFLSSGSLLAVWPEAPLPPRLSISSLAKQTCEKGTSSWDFTRIHWDKSDNMLS